MSVEKGVLEQIRDAVITRSNDDDLNEQVTNIRRLLYKTEELKKASKEKKITIEEIEEKIEIEIIEQIRYVWMVLQRYCPRTYDDFIVQKFISEHPPLPRNLVTDMFFSSETKNFKRLIREGLNNKDFLMIYKALPDNNIITLYLEIEKFHKDDYVHHTYDFPIACVLDFIRPDIKNIHIYDKEKKINKEKERLLQENEKLKIYIYACFISFRILDKIDEEEEEGEEGEEEGEEEEENKKHSIESMFLEYEQEEEKEKHEELLALKTKIIQYIKEKEIYLPPKAEEVEQFKWMLYTDIMLNLVAKDVVFFLNYFYYVQPLKDKINTKDPIFPNRDIVSRLPKDLKLGVFEDLSPEFFFSRPDTYVLCETKMILSDSVSEIHEDGNLIEVIHNLARVWNNRIITTL
jgi:hypothetical protein